MALPNNQGYATNYAQTDSHQDGNGVFRELGQDVNSYANRGIGFPTSSSPGTGTLGGGYDLEAFRKAWYGKGDVNDVQGWLDRNRNITQGVTLKNGQHAYDAQGNYIADLVGNLNDPNQAKHAQFLDGIGSNGKKRPAKGKGAPSASPMVAANGSVPPGLGYNPVLTRQGFTAATPQQQPLDTTFQDRENTLIKQLLDNPVYDQNFQNQLNEQQKELAIQRNSDLQANLLQNAASAGRTNSGAFNANRMQLDNDLTTDLLKSQRDISMGVQADNRQSLMDALDMSGRTSFNRNQNQSQFFNNLMRGREFDLDRDLAIEGLRRGADTSNLNWNQFRQGQHEFNVNDQRRVDEFGRTLGFQYDNANLNSQNGLIDAILRGGR
jgi:hypothetical protein